METRLEGPFMVTLNILEDRARKHRKLDIQNMARKVITTVNSREIYVRQKILGFMVPAYF